MITGMIEVNQCPKTLVTADVWDLLNAEYFVRNGGGWPTGGGWLDQTAMCVEGIRFVMAERNELESE